MQPLTLEERLMHIKTADKRFNTDWTWLADSMQNEVKNAFGNRNNSEFIIDPQGIIVKARTWSDEETLREDLTKYVGKPEQVTTVADLGKDMSYRPVEADSKPTLPRIEAPAGAKVVRVKAVESEEPYYIKLRAEAAPSLIKNGIGKLKLGFHIDPIHHVHWNNLAPPLQYKITSEGSFTPAEATAPKIEQESDTSPREFLVDVTKVTTEKPMEIEVSYFACHDTEKWCKAVSQKFLVTLKEDKHAGRVQMGRSKGKGRSKLSPQMIMTRMDTNGDGIISLSESKGPMVQRFQTIDKDQDQQITMQELREHFASRRR